MEHPLVSVVTPFYNEEPYLERCIESVINQKYSNFEYILINNCSTDRSRDIVQAFCEKDSRIILIDNKSFLTQIQNLNKAMSNVNVKSKYVKMVLGDDWIYPNCLEEMVAIAESDPEVAAVGAYTLHGYDDHANVYLYGLPEHLKIIDGLEICRNFLLGGPYVFGSPTTTMIRTDIVLERQPFYDEKSVICDNDVFFEFLPGRKFGFVHQVLTYTRRNNESTFSKNKQYNIFDLGKMTTMNRYGIKFLNPHEYYEQSKKVRKEYYMAVGKSLILGAPDGYLEFQRRELEESGKKLSMVKVVVGIVVVIITYILNPLQSAQSIMKKLMPQKT